MIRRWSCTAASMLETSFTCIPAMTQSRGPGRSPRISTMGHRQPASCGLAKVSVPRWMFAWPLLCGVKFIGSIIPGRPNPRNGGKAVIRAKPYCRPPGPDDLGSFLP